VKEGRKEGRKTEWKGEKHYYNVEIAEGKASIALIRETKGQRGQERD
jgi:hypothetical protein